MTPEFMKALREKVDSHCTKCDTDLVPRIMSAMSGFYVGTSCKCGPYSRESDYYAFRSEAQAVLDDG
jgi:hypothetical protein